MSIRVSSSSPLSKQAFSPAGLSSVVWRSERSPSSCGSERSPGSSWGGNPKRCPSLRRHRVLPFLHLQSKPRCKFKLESIAVRSPPPPRFTAGFLPHPRSAHSFSTSDAFSPSSQLQARKPPSSCDLLKSDGPSGTEPEPGPLITTNYAALRASSLCHQAGKIPLPRRCTLDTTALPPLPGTSFFHLKNDYCHNPAVNRPLERGKGLHGLFQPPG